MKIIIVNKFYYPRGGDCVCALNLEKLLRDKGHEVAFFSMKYSENIPSDNEDYFPEEVSFSGGLTNKIKAVSRLFTPKDVKACFIKLLDDFSPDVIHLHNIHSYLSPIIGEVAKKRGIRVVWTMHDYKLVCPSYSCLSNGRICEECMTTEFAILKNKCMKGSLLASCLAYMEAKFWNKRVLEKQTDLFICPSEFMYKKMAQGGFSSSKLTVLNNFVDKNLFPQAALKRQNYFCYVGRLSHEKGCETLLSVVSKMPYTLKILGTGPLFDTLKQKYASARNILFMGHQPEKVVREVLADARFSVLSSECFENNPMGVIESLCMGTPVLGANIGGIPELINHNNGRIFQSRDKDSLKTGIETMFQENFDYVEIQKAAFHRFDKDIHYGELINIYK